MILIVDPDIEEQKRIRHLFFAKFAICTCGAVPEEVEEALSRYPVAAVYLPRTALLDDPIGFCRAFKLAHPNVALVAGVQKSDPAVDLDALYGVTDNIPLLPIATVRLAEILCELIRLYTGRDRLEQIVNGVVISIYHPNVFFCGVKIRFGISSLSLLSYLASQAPRCVPSPELTQNVGSPYAPPYDVGRIRKLVFDVNARARAAIGRPIIVNVKGEGYRIDPFATLP